MSIAENVKSVLENVEKAALRSGRRAEDVTVIGIAKTVDADSVVQMAHAGICDVGENRVQELLAKREVLINTVPGLRYHMVGHLQSNKVKQAVASSDMIHSVDSVKLAGLINRHAGEMGKVMDILAEINIAGEGSKFGLAPDDVTDFVREIMSFHNINLRGLMCVAPFVENPEDNRVYFRKMRGIGNHLNEGPLRERKMDTLSMGMTLDYEVAIEEGATMVRIGTAIFGART